MVNFRRDGSSYICMGGIEPGQQHKQFDLAFERGNGNDEEDARLISAAPDLLALVELVHSSFDGGLTITFSELDVKEFSAAIAKARGQA